MIAISVMLIGGGASAIAMAGDGVLAGKSKNKTKNVSPSATESKSPEGAGKLSLRKPVIASTQPKGTKPQVEIFIPSFQRLSEQFRRSRTMPLARALSEVFPIKPDPTGEGLDVGAAFSLLERVSAWPDTSIAFTTYSIDREGSARWAVRIDWPIDDLKTRLAGMLESDAGKSILKDIKLTPAKDDGFVIELPDLVLARVKKSGKGSLVLSTESLKPPTEIFGARPESDDKADSRKQPRLIYCLLNLGNDDEEEGGASVFSAISGVMSVRYAASVGESGLWRERINLQWNPFAGALLKTIFKKTTEKFTCPNTAFVGAAFHFGSGEGLADSIADLPHGTIGSSAGEEMAFVAAPGTGFLPIPDMFYQFSASDPKKIVKNIRKAMKKDAAKRREDDLKPLWHEGIVDGAIVFWREGGEDGGGGSYLSMRTIVFFDPPYKTGQDDSEEEVSKRLIVAHSSTWADDVARHWKSMQASAKHLVTMPGSKQAHWEARIFWRQLYEFLAPYATIMSGTSEDASAPPSGEELALSLVDSVIGVQIGFKGVDARHEGPIPIGVVYVPAVAAMSLSATGSASSEAQRERVACQHLRVLYHHAKLFNKDYGRWPANVAELDGYVDFASHPELLNLRQKNQGVVIGFAKMFTGKKSKAESDEQDDRDIDDTLYEIDWSPKAWKLKIRAKEFVNYETILVDQDGEIHRIEKKKSSDQVLRETTKKISQRYEKRPVMR
jgi:hypothetical protein